MSQNSIKIKNIKLIQDYSEDLYNYIKSDDALITLEGNTIHFPYVFLSETIEGDDLKIEKEFEKHKPFLEKFSEFLADQNDNFVGEFETAFISLSNGYYYINFLVKNDKYKEPLFNSFKVQLLIKDMYGISEDDFDSEEDFVNQMDIKIDELIIDFVKGNFEDDLFIDYANF